MDLSQKPTEWLEASRDQAQNFLYWYEEQEESTRRKLGTRFDEVVDFGNAITEEIARRKADEAPTVPVDAGTGGREGIENEAQARSIEENYAETQRRFAPRSDGSEPKTGFEQIQDIIRAQIGFERGYQVLCGSLSLHGEQIQALTARLEEIEARHDAQARATRQILAQITQAFEGVEGLS